MSGAPAPLPVPDPGSRADDEHLRLLAIFHWVWAGLRMFAGLLTAAMGVFFATVLADVFESIPGPGGAAPPGGGPSPAAVFRGFGTFYGAMCVGIAVWEVLLAVLSAFAAHRLAARRHRTFCFVVAVLTCLSIPLGTVLGIFTLMVLSRPSVIDQFDRIAPGAPRPAAR